MSLLPKGWIPERPLEEEITNLQVDVLSARCASDRLRLRTPIEVVANTASVGCVEKLQADLKAVMQFVGEIERVQARRHGLLPGA